MVLGAKDPIIDGEIVDDPRIDYLSSHINALEKAIALGADVRGFYPWSFIDLLSWLNGYQKQYGFVYVDHQQNRARKRKKELFLVSKRYCQPRRTALIFPPGRRPAPDLVVEYS